MAENLATEQMIARLRAECGCEAGAITALVTSGAAAVLLFFQVPSWPTHLLWTTAALLGLATGLVAKLLAVARARIRLRRLLAEAER